VTFEINCIIKFELCLFIYLWEEYEYPLIYWAEYIKKKKKTINKNNITTALKQTLEDQPMKKKGKREGGCWL
jgi:hypothetical protein